MAGKKRVPSRMKSKKEFKPQGFTKKEWITMGIVVAVIALAILGYFLLRDFFDGSLRISGGKVQAEDNWIVVNTGTTDKPKYFKLGTVSPVDGYTLTTEHYTGDDNVPTYLYTPDDTASTIENVTLLAAKGTAEELASKVSANYASYLKNAVPSEVKQVSVGGRTGWGFSCDYDDEQTAETAAATPAPEATVAADAATPAPEATPAPVTKAARVVTVYFEASHSMSVLSSITAKADDAAQLPSAEELYTMLDPFVKGMTVDNEVVSTAAPAASAEAAATAASDIAASSDAVATEAPAAATEAPVVTEAPAAATEAPVVTEAPAAATEAPAVTEAPAAATEAPAPAATEAPAPAATEAPVVTEAPTEAAVSSKAAVEPTAEPTVAPTAEPTVAPTVEPTVAPTAEPTVAPTAEPTVAPTAEPTIEPTVAPTAEPTAEPTVAATAEATPLPEGALPVTDGKVQVEGNWLVYKLATKDQPIYKKMGEVQPVDGYTLSTEKNASDENLPDFFYLPIGESQVEDVRVMAANYSAQESAERAAKGYAAYFQNGVSSEVTQVEIAGRTGWFFSCDYENAIVNTSDATPAPDATPAASAGTVRVVSVYFDAPDGLSAVVSLTTKPGDAAALQDVATLTKAMEPFVQMLAIEGDLAAATVATVEPAEATAAPAEASAAPSPAA